MNIENTKAQMRKGILEFCILSLLKKEDLYTSEILEKLTETIQEKTIIKKTLVNE